MRKIYMALAAVTLLAFSCQKDLGGNPTTPDAPSVIPADFDWKTTEDVAISVAAPVVDGKTPSYAVISVYSSPILSAENLKAKGATQGAVPFRSAFTIPAGTENLYVQTTLPDGTKSIRMVETRSTVDVPGATINGVSAKVNSLGDMRASELKPSTMPTDYPKLEENPIFDVTITEAPTASYTFGTNWGAAVPAQNYLIPAGTVIATTLFDFNGGTTHKAPVLYVAGKLTMDNTTNLGQTTLAVLPGGEVYVKNLTAQNIGTAPRPAIYVFEGGKLSMQDANLSCKALVNHGEIRVEETLDINNQLVFYNTASASLLCDELIYSNSGGFHNDGRVEIADLEFNSSTSFENYENGVVHIVDCEMANNGNRFYQRGKAHIENLESNGKFYVYCYTYIDNVESDNGSQFNLATDACLETINVHFNGVQMDLAPGSLFIAQEYNTDGKGYGNTIMNQSKDTDKPAVIRFEKRAIASQGAKTDFMGPIEIVYNTEGLDKKYEIRDSYIKHNAYQVAVQQANIPATECNGGKGQITPEPEPEPETFVNVTGQTYTYCFEDNWPWLGDYDMNDVVLVSRIDRMTSKDGSKVASLTINWELRAAGTTYDIACAVQMDKIATSDVAAVESSHKGFGQGAFASQGLESEGTYAVVPFFNDTKELLSTWNTWKGHAATPTQKHTTTINFVQPVDIKTVLDSEMNVFITPKERTNEIHMPGYAQTALGVVGKGSFQPNDPYKFYVADGDQIANNYMMWALVIPGEFNYPAEVKDIRGVYEHFMTWASSNGLQHPMWYLEEANADSIY